MGNVHCWGAVRGEQTMSFLKTLQIATSETSPTSEVTITDGVLAMKQSSIRQLWK